MCWSLGGSGSEFKFVDVLGHVPYSYSLLCPPRGLLRAIVNTSLALMKCQARFKALKICLLAVYARPGSGAGAAVIHIHR